MKVMIEGIFDGLLVLFHHPLQILQLLDAIRDLKGLVATKTIANSLNNLQINITMT